MLLAEHPVPPPLPDRGGGDSAPRRESMVLLLCGLAFISRVRMALLPLDLDLEPWDPEAQGGVTSPLTVDGTKVFEYWRSWAFVWDTQSETRFWMFMYRS